MYDGKDRDIIIYHDVIKDGICALMYRGDGEQNYKVSCGFSYPEDTDALYPWLSGNLRSIIEALSLTVYKGIL